MSESPYPRGRWTAASEPAKSQRVPLFSESAAALIKAPLRELFWGLPESGVLEEARQRVEATIAAALARTPSLEAPAAVQLALI